MTTTTTTPATYTTAEVAIALGVTTGRVRQLATQRGLGTRSALGWLFTADDISHLRVRGRAGRPQNQLSIELDRVIDQSVASGFELPAAIAVRRTRTILAWLTHMARDVDVIRAGDGPLVITVATPTGMITISIASQSGRLTMSHIAE